MTSLILFPLIPFGYYIYNNIKYYNPFSYHHFILENNYSNNNSLFLDNNTINENYLNSIYDNNSILSNFTNIFSYLNIFNNSIFYNLYYFNNSKTNINDISNDWIDLSSELDNIETYNNRAKYYKLDKMNISINDIQLNNTLKYNHDDIEIPSLNNSIINYQKNSINMKCDKIIDKRNLYQKSILHNDKDIDKNIDNIELIFKNNETKDNITITL